MKNFLFTAPPWLSNLLSVVLAVLVAVSTIGNDVVALFTDLNCAQCVQIVQKVLSIVAVVLAFIKAFSKYASKPEEE